MTAQTYDVHVYSKEDCPRCEQLKEALAKSGIPFITHDLDTAEGLADMRADGCFALEAPVLSKKVPLENGDTELTFWFGDALFPNGELDDTELPEMIRNG